MRLIDADALKRKVQRVATEAWKMKLTAKVETTLNQFIDWIEDAQTIEPSAPPEQKKGKWERVYLDHVASGERPSIFYCSSCNQCVPFPTNFCPACGSDNRQS